MSGKRWASVSGRTSSLAACVYLSPASGMTMDVGQNLIPNLHTVWSVQVLQSWVSADSGAKGITIEDHRRMRSSHWVWWLLNRFQCWVWVEGKTVGVESWVFTTSFHPLWASVFTSWRQTTNSCFLVWSYRAHNKMQGGHLTQAWAPNGNPMSWGQDC